MPELISDIIFYFYCGNIIAALLSYLPQQIILINMIRGIRPVSDDISSTQFWIWTIANLVGTCYVVLIVETDIPLIILSTINFFHCLISASLISYVHYLYNKHTSVKPISGEKEHVDD